LALSPPAHPLALAQKAAEARDENAWAFWLEVERAVKELLTETTPPGTTQHSPNADKKNRLGRSSFPYPVGVSSRLPSTPHAENRVR
jgi:hypothetical protein